MKKAISLLLCVLLLFSLAACSKQGQGGTAAAEWTREGYFTDDRDNFLNIQTSPYDEYPGWYVGCMLGEGMYGWIVQQEGDTLHGDIMPEYEEGEFIVTVTEEGEDGVLLTTEASDTYHFTPYDMPPVIASVTLNTEGLGRVAYAEEGGELILDGDPYQSAVINVAEPAVYQIGARAEDGWTFVKWTKDGEDFTTEPVFTVTIEESADFIAVFEEAQ